MTYLYREFYLYNENDPEKEWIISSIGGMDKFEEKCIEFAREQFDFKGKQEDVLFFLSKNGYNHGLSKIG